jgi:hypothetical protein
VLPVEAHSRRPHLRNNSNQAYDDATALAPEAAEACPPRAEADDSERAAAAEFPPVDDASAALLDAAEACGPWAEDSEAAAAEALPPDEDAAARLSADAAEYGPCPYADALEEAADLA